MVCLFDSTYTDYKITNTALDEIWVKEYVNPKEQNFVRYTLVY